MIIAFSILVLMGLIVVGWGIFTPARLENEEMILPPPMPLEEMFPQDTLNTYQERARFWHTPSPTNLPCYALGICGEAGEVAELVKKHLGHGADLDREKLTLELGDVLWYVAALATVYEIPLDEVAEKNLQKLSARYPNGFVKGGGKR